MRPLELKRLASTRVLTCKFPDQLLFLLSIYAVIIYANIYADTSRISMMT